MNEFFVNKELSLPNNVTRMVLEAKLKNLPFAVLKSGPEMVIPKKSSTNIKPMLDLTKQE